MAKRPTEEPRQPVSDEPYIEPDVSAFEILWIKHRPAFIAGFAMLALAIIGVGGWIAYTQVRHHNAVAAFAGANDAEALRAVIDKYPSSVVAGNAALLLAGIERDAGNLDGANSLLADFARRQPRHPFAPVAKLAIAENAALAAEFDTALAGLQGVSDEFPGSFVAPFALLQKAELSLALNNRNEALRTLEVLSRLYPSSVSAESSTPVFDALMAMARPAADAASDDRAPAESGSAPSAGDVPAAVETAPAESGVEQAADDAPGADGGMAE